MYEFFLRIEYKGRKKDPPNDRNEIKVVKYMMGNEKRVKKSESKNQIETHFSVI